MLSNSAKAEIKELGGDAGFWKPDTEDALLGICEELCETMNEQSAVDTVCAIFGLAREEYGD